MKTAKKLMLAAVVLPIVLGSASALAAGGKNKGPDGEMCGPDGERGIFKQLNLTAEQHAKLRQMREEGREQMQQKRQAGPSEQMKAMRDKERALMLAPNFDKAQATELAKQMVDMQVERRVQMMEKRHQMLNVLTPEQKTQFQNLQQERMAKCWENGPREGHHGGKGSKGQNMMPPAPPAGE
ncbi:CpxP family protein [Vibrio fluvialis]|nr:CpxP family protein [Vibrio fluvialis]MBY8104478.1 CpxP family protein [Vibrio fluvialis]